jgi:hypothetical protein
MLVSARLDVPGFERAPGDRGNDGVDGRGRLIGDFTSAMLSSSRCE